MSQAAGLKQQSASQGNKMILGELLARHTLDALSDESSKRILVSTVSRGKTVQEISVEQAVPLSSCYRRARELVHQGLLVVERIVLSDDGRRYAVFRSSFKTVEMTSDFTETSVSVELNDDTADKFRRKLASL